jgi:hypothetical protein
MKSEQIRMDKPHLRPRPLSCTVAWEAAAGSLDRRLPVQQSSASLGADVVQPTSDRSSRWSHLEAWPPHLHAVLVLLGSGRRLCPCAGRCCDLGRARWTSRRGGHHRTCPLRPSVTPGLPPALPRPPVKAARWNRRSSMAPSPCLAVTLELRPDPCPLRCCRPLGLRGLWWVAQDR